MKVARNVTPNAPASTQTPPRPSHDGANGHNGNGVPKQACSNSEEIEANAVLEVNGTSVPEVDKVPGPFINSRMDYWVTKKDRPEVHPDRDVILSAAWNGSGESVVREHHVAKFN